MRPITIASTVALLTAAAAALPACSDPCSYVSGGTWSARCPGDAHYEVRCTPGELAGPGTPATTAAAPTYACQCVKDGTVGRSFERTEPLYDITAEGVRIVNEACGWEVPDP